MQAPRTVDKDVDRLERELSESNKAFNRSKACTRALVRNLASVAAIKEALDTDRELGVDDGYAELCWNEVDYQDQCDLMLAPKFGGCFTTRERAEITKFWKVTTLEAGL